MLEYRVLFFFSSKRRHTRWPRDWSSDVCSSDLQFDGPDARTGRARRRHLVSNPDRDRAAAGSRPAQFPASAPWGKPGVVRPRRLCPVGPRAPGLYGELPAGPRARTGRAREARERGVRLTARCSSAMQSQRSGTNTVPSAAGAVEPPLRAREISTRTITVARYGKADINCEGTPTPQPCA